MQRAVCISKLYPKCTHLAYYSILRVYNFAYVK